MNPNDLSSVYAARTAEYLIAVAFLILFVPFWRYIDGKRVFGRVVAEVPKRLRTVADWFRMADDVIYHPGHSWARPQEDGTVVVGMDDFAHALIGPEAVRLPAIGTKVRQGEAGWMLSADGKVVDMLSPIDGTVVGVNFEVEQAPGKIKEDPYGAGWLLKIEPARLAANTKNLLDGKLARAWMREVTEKLRRQMNPDLGAVYQDGGAVVDGIARNLDPESWDQVAREFLLS